jgi:hypothetical protein
MRHLVFGYGSLATPGQRQAVLHGYRRVWNVAMDNTRDLPGYKYYVDAETGERPAVMVAFVNIEPHDGSEVKGSLIEVDDLAALDARERNYQRIRVDVGEPAWTYVGTEEAKRRFAQDPTVVARRYLDQVPATTDLPVSDLARIDLA